MNKVINFGEQWLGVPLQFNSPDPGESCCSHPPPTLVQTSKGRDGAEGWKVAHQSPTSNFPSSVHPRDAIINCSLVVLARVVEVVMVTCIKKWGSTRHFSKYFTCIHSFNPHKNFRRQSQLLYPFYRWGNVGKERTNNFLKFMQLESSRIGIWNMVVTYELGKLTSKRFCLLNDGRCNPTHSWWIIYEYIWWLLLTLWRNYYLNECVFYFYNSALLMEAIVDFATR